jgi:hypothetical protein
VESIPGIFFGSTRPAEPGSQIDGARQDLLRLLLAALVAAQTQQPYVSYVVKSDHALDAASLRVLRGDQLFLHGFLALHVSSCPCAFSFH